MLYEGLRVLIKHQAVFSQSYTVLVFFCINILFFCVKRGQVAQMKGWSLGVRSWSNVTLICPVSSYHNFISSVKSLHLTHVRRPAVVTVLDIVCGKSSVEV